MPLLTVLMPVYNAERYITESVDSILHQTLTDFEFLIIDDGSTDSTADIVRAYGDSRIRLIKNNVNLGISETLNKGIAIAQCELIARMDADDISLPHRLQTQFDYMIDHPEKYQPVNASSSADVKPGDIAVNGDHTYIFVGKVNGFSTQIASASISFSGRSWRAPMSGHEMPGDPNYSWFRPIKGISV